MNYYHLLKNNYITLQILLKNRNKSSLNLLEENYMNIAYKSIPHKKKKKKIKKFKYRNIFFNIQIYTL
ncbi:hypothetical protein PFAG_04551 [Plasmodium falciparum Santa Lucia]|uniref:Uncharacterized protein n=4 Tax=Plasmodium falciparum TaxID=5833 RepID=A0A024X4H6_PLAFC|nr:hypothetical protein PFNF135_04717 [Plasmodium falciparum NF135/5.C10]ETW59706.1 hypothetical protein PFMC_04515 [Plasmodium falciparum CAMP/Malaysia]EUT81338.1 hypothetical protein PFAG_04551 [Plasmodium falciparum Santa Lucia]EWC74695.1 hypothetical protein C923_04638 [Plasmodium falciparum UGT5.1]